MPPGLYTTPPQYVRPGFVPVHPLPDERHSPARIHSAAPRAPLPLAVNLVALALVRWPLIDRSLGRVLVAAVSLLLGWWTALQPRDRRTERLQAVELLALGTSAMVAMAVRSGVSREER